MLRACKENRESKGSGFQKLDKVNAEAVQANLKTDFQRITIKHHEEVTKFLAKERDYVDKIAQELVTIKEPTQAEENILNILEDDEEPTESV